LHGEGGQARIAERAILARRCKRAAHAARPMASTDHADARRAGALVPVATPRRPGRRAELPANCGNVQGHNLKQNPYRRETP
jgi:hypothetical protein